MRSETLTVSHNKPVSNRRCPQSSRCAGTGWHPACDAEEIGGRHELHDASVIVEHQTRASAHTVELTRKPPKWTPRRAAHGPKEPVVYRTSAPDAKGRKPRIGEAQRRFRARRPPREPHLDVSN